MRSIFIKSFVLALFLTQHAWAADIDRKEPIHVEADHMQYDTANRINIYTGNVIARQGSLSIRSYIIEVQQDKNGYQLGKATGSAKNRVFFRQERNQENERVEGEAIKLEYDGRTATIKLTGDAVLRRYRGEELVDQTAGGIITYNDNTSFFTVESGKNSHSSTGRVSSIFTPPSE